MWDDSLEICELVKRFIRVAGGESHVANNGHDALQLLLQGFTPDVIFLDYMMPDMNGLEVLDRLQQEESTRKIPVVMYTANSDQSLQQEALRRGAVAFLIKSEAGLVEFRRYLNEPLPSQRL